MARKFRGRRRLIVYLATDGHCALCGAELRRDWEADHRQPYARGGPTAVWNGQALCRACNRRKGAHMPPTRTDPRPPREWQIDQLERWREWPDTDFLNVATMGAGKTGGACMIGRDALDRQRIDFLVIVVPTNHLRRQWARAAAAYGLHLNPNWRNADTVPAPDDHGVVITYAQLAATPGAADYWRRFCARRRVGFVGDEIHHCGEQKAWGEAIGAAFERAAFRLHLSGTPFRCDRNNLIPFVPTDDLGNGQFRARPSYAYTYAMALVAKPQVCRDVYFPSYEGEMRWAGNAEHVMVASFADPIPSEEQSRRLRTALEPKPDGWLATVLREANAELSSMRQAGHASAGGLVVAMDIEHARQICKLLERISSEPPILATSDDPIASELIEQFNRGTQRWLVAVRMVSEGADIVRLRCCVYATNIVAPLFVHQVIGRVVRYDASLDAAQYACVYVPDERRLVAIVRQFQEERDLAFKVRLNTDPGAPGEGGTGKPQSPWTPLSAQAEVSTVYARSGDYSPSEAAFARQIQVQTGLEKFSIVDVASIIRAVSPSGAGTAPPPAAPPDGERPAFERKKEVTDMINMRVRHLVLKEVLPRYGRDDADFKTQTFKRVRQWLAQKMGAYQREATLEQLEEGAAALYLALSRGLPQDLIDHLEA